MINRSMLTRSTFVAAVMAAFAMAASGQTTAAEPMGKDKVAIEAAFAKADANADGKLTKEEAMAVPTVAAKFAELDKNKDGFLTLAEFSAGFTAG